MELAVYHQFQPLSIKDSGKQHRFSWYEWKGKEKSSEFIVHAMYQSGSDPITTTDGQQAKRGEVIRLQFNEGGKCEPGNGIELKIDDHNWRENDYKKIANNVLHNLKTNGEQGEPLNTRQKVAVLTQLSSLYNLMATQYGTVFMKGIQNSKDHKDSLDELITDRKLKTVSKYFEELAQDLLTGKPPHADLNLPPEPAQENIPKWLLTHSIEIQNGQKGHPFAIWKRKENIPNRLSPHLLDENSPYNKVAEAMYISGELGEKIAVFPMDAANPMQLNMENGLGLRARLGEEAMRYRKSENIVQSLIETVPTIQNAQVIAEGMNRGTVNQDQAISAFLMLASLNRLIATRYNGGFGYNSDGTRMPPHFFDDKTDDKDASTAKKYAKKLAQGRKETFDIKLKDNQMYTRPLLISDAKSLSEFVNDSKFEKEANSYLDVATKMMDGKSLAESVQAANIPNWELKGNISNTSRIAHR